MMLSEEPPIAYVYSFIMMSEAQPPEHSFNTGVNISTLTYSGGSTCHNIRNKTATHPSFYSFVCICLGAKAAAVGSRKQMEPRPSSDQKTMEAVEGLQRLVFQTRSLYLRQLPASVLPGQPPKGARIRKRLFSGNFSLRN